MAWNKLIFMLNFACTIAILTLLVGRFIYVPWLAKEMSKRLLS